jgi:hypothetical protein
MDPQLIRITIELPQGSEVQASGGTTDGTVRDVDPAPASRAIDAGPPPAALVATLGDPERPTASVALATVTDKGSSSDAIDAGSFPARLAAEMESEGPRHPMGHPEIGTQASVLGRESRN